MYYIEIKKNFVHQFGDQPRIYYDARSTSHQDFLITSRTEFMSWTLN